MTGQLAFPLRSYPHEARAFIAANPEWWALVTQAALEYHAAGRRVGMKALVEWSRFELNRRALPSGGKPYRVNNSHTSSFARLLIAEHPELSDTIETRRADCAA